MCFYYFSNKTYISNIPCIPENHIQYAMLGIVNIDRHVSCFGKHLIQINKSIQFITWKQSLNVIMEDIFLNLALLHTYMRKDIFCQICLI